MNQHNFKRMVALLLACLMTMGCFACVAEEMDAAVQDPCLAEELGLVDGEPLDSSYSHLLEEAEREGIVLGEAEKSGKLVGQIAISTLDEVERTILEAVESGKLAEMIAAGLFDDEAMAKIEEMIATGRLDASVLGKPEGDGSDTDEIERAILEAVDSGKLAEMIAAGLFDAEAMEKIYAMIEAGRLDASVLGKSEDTGSCAHAHTDSYEYMQNAEYTPVDDKYHETCGYLVTVVYCDDCGETLSRVMDTEKSTRQDRHDFSREEGTCYECGAVNTCTHKSTYMDEYWQNVEHTPIDEKTHERRGHRVTRIWCEDCEMTLSEEVSPEISSEIERHWFEDGACEVCGYVNTCSHAHTTVEKYPSYDEGEYTAIDNRQHQWRGHLTIELRCLDCEEVLSSELGEELVSQIWDHEFEDGVCYWCGYVNTCAHKHTYVDSYCGINLGTMTPVDAEVHEFSGYPEYIEFCVDCGESLRRWRAEKPITRLEDHYFEAGVCGGCGYSINCAHKRVDRGSYFEGSTYEDAGSDRYHIAHGTLYRIEVCLDCDKLLSRETSDFTNKDSHNYVNGRCENCGHVKACDHSRTVEGEWETPCEYKDVSATSHTYRVILEKHLECAICGQDLGKTGDVRETVKTEQHYFYDNAVCICGRRNTCKHNGKINEHVYWQDDTVYTPVDGTYHMAEGTQIKNYTCTQCGRLMNTENLGYAKKKVEHNISKYRGYCWSCYADGVAEPPKSVSIVQQNQKLSIGETLQLTAEISPAGASTTLTWSSSDKRIATVDANGLVTPVKEGSVTITVKTANGKSGTTKITVVDPYKLTGVKLDKTGTVNLNLGETLTLNPIPVPETALSTYSWKTSSTKIATVADGVVTPVGEGTATITVTATRGKIKKTATVKVKVVDPYKPTSVKLDRTGTVNLNLGESLTLTPSLSPETAQATYTWKTSSTKIATVVDGVVTPIGEGTATITVTANRGKIKKTATVKVKVVDPYKPTSVKLDKTGTVNLNLGETLTLSPSLSPETAQATYSWKSSSTKIATVADGVVTPIGEGTATITVTATRGKIKKTATVKVKVVDPYKPTAVKLDKTGTVNLNLGETLTLSPSLSPETAQATYTWKTSSTKIATVVDGVVTPVGEGTATITVTATRGKIKKTATVKVKVVDPYKPTAVKLDKTGTVWLDLDSTMQLWPYIEPVDLDPEKGEVTYTWKSSSTKIATVNSMGEVTPVSTGTATITVTATRGAVKKTASVKVKVCKPGEPDALFLRSEFVDASGVLRLQRYQMCFFGTEVQPSSARNNVYLEYKSSNEQVVTVQKGNGDTRVFAAGAGSATITVTDTLSGKKATIKVVVKK